MKCHEIGLLLDGIDACKRTPAQRRAIEAHLAVCRACREAWAAWEEVAACPVLPMPVGLGARVAEALETSGLERTRHARRRRIIFGAGLAVFGAAVAATIAWRPEGAAPDVSPAAGKGVRPSVAAPARPESEAENRPHAGGDSAAKAVRQPSAVPEPGAALDPNSIVVLPMPDEDANPHVAAILNQFYEEVLLQLGQIEGLTVVSPERVQPFIGSRLPEKEIARQLGAGTIVVLGTDDPEYLGLWVMDGATGASRGDSVGLLREPVTRAEIRELAQQAVAFVEKLTTQSKIDPLAYIADARATILNAALTDAERVGALLKLPMRSPGAYDDAILAAAVEIATTSGHPGLRGQVWLAMWGVEDPYLIDPLLQSLAYDADPYVRRMAASALGTFRDEPRVRAALSQAQARDKAGDVREAAHLALLSDQERNELALTTLLDETLPAGERLGALSVFDGRMVRGVPLTAEAARAVFDIGAGSNDDEIRSSAWYSLARQKANDPAFTGTLLHDLAHHTSEAVRGGAARALKAYRDDPIVRAALEQAQNDPSAEVRRAARRALEVADP